ncbi:hypothetical protein [Kribbella hippodromi]
MASSLLGGPPAHLHRHHRDHHHAGCAHDRCLHAGRPPGHSAGDTAAADADCRSDHGPDECADYYDNDHHHDDRTGYDHDHYPRQEADDSAARPDQDTG